MFRLLRDMVGPIGLWLAGGEARLSAGGGLRPSANVPTDGRRSVAFRSRSAFTLVELLIAATITAMVTVVLSGLVMAVQRSWSFTQACEEVSMQARASLDRMQTMIRQAGVYRLPGQPTRLGLAVVAHRWGFVRFPDVLVVWSGGREGGMSRQGVLERLPRLNELVIYTYEPDQPSCLVEIAFPDDGTPIDFDAATFSDTILDLLRSPSAERVLLCDRLRTSRLPSARRSNRRLIGLVRFELIRRPDEFELAMAESDPEAWQQLGWPQGIATRTSGLRQETVRIELQLTRHPTTDETPPSEAIPFFGSASCRYVYQR